MKPLDTTFIEKGFTYTQLERDGNLAIYRQEKPNQNPCFEVVKIRHQKESKFKVHAGTSEETTVLNPEKELYPNSEQWGDLGWTFRTIGEAQERFSELKRVRTEEEARKAELESVA